ncbi:unnamed protein product [Paramecium octaurelia]|uniref:Uncharacterized protein n=1 Tax=Paramecium octaurelia TaxID=43137 RepID=A0A8S1U7V7_PAROT|nr:unnamed protein product [Paramecium octaurelia]
MKQFQKMKRYNLSFHQMIKARKLIVKKNSLIQQKERIYKKILLKAMLREKPMSLKLKNLNIIMNTFTKKQLLTILLKKT